MDYFLPLSMQRYIDTHLNEFRQLLIDLCQIPAPLHQERARAEFCKAWLEKKGAQGVTIDDQDNVIYPYECQEGKPLIVWIAHTDTVFPDTIPFSIQEKNGRWFCPGIGDDTVHVATLLMMAAYLLESGMPASPYGLLFVADSGEEGLGNLRGAREIVRVYGNRIAEFLAFDGGLNRIVNQAVGSSRFLIRVRAQGGHSYGKFGNTNAIHHAAEIISALYAIQVPNGPGDKTTYNVGTITGGTSVNTIAQECQFTYEYRSNRVESLQFMQEQLDRVLSSFQAKGYQAEAECIGQRPCGKDVDEAALSRLIERVARISLQVTGGEVRYDSGSTDCNIPLSQGIPAVAFGCYQTTGAHTREESLDLSSLPQGLEIGMALLQEYLAIPEEK